MPAAVAFKRTDEHILAYQHSRELAAMLYYINKASSSEVVWLLAAVPHTPILLNTLKLRLEAGSWRSQRFWPPGEEFAPPQDWHDEALPSEDVLDFLPGLAAGRQLQMLAEDMQQDSDDDQLQGLARAEELLAEEAALAEANHRRAKRRLNALKRKREQHVPYRMDRDKVVEVSTGKVLGKISVMVAWNRPSCSGRCFEHTDCSVTADLGAISELTQWVADGVLHSNAQDHWLARPAMRMSRMRRRR